MANCTIIFIMHHVTCMLFYDASSVRTIDTQYLSKYKHQDNEELIQAACYLDNRKNPFTSTLFEWGAALREAEYALKHVRKWSQPKSKNTPLPIQPASCRIQPMPKGVVLVRGDRALAPMMLYQCRDSLLQIIAPWNYAFQLTLGPLASALAAGNSVILKPSELAPHATVCSSMVTPILKSCVLKGSH